MESIEFWEWFWLIALMAIPIVNIIVFIAGACGVGKRSFVNYCRALLLWLIIGIGLAFLYGALSG